MHRGQFRGCYKETAGRSCHGELPLLQQLPGPHLAPRKLSQLQNQPSSTPPASAQLPTFVKFALQLQHEHQPVVPAALRPPAQPGRELKRRSYRSQPGESNTPVSVEN